MLSGLIAAGLLDRGDRLAAWSDPASEMVVRRFGRIVVPDWGPGLHWGSPWGLIASIACGPTRCGD